MSATKVDMYVNYRSATATNHAGSIPARSTGWGYGTDEVFAASLQWDVEADSVTTRAQVRHAGGKREVRTSGALSDLLRSVAQTPAGRRAMHAAMLDAELQYRMIVVDGKADFTAERIEAAS